MNDFFTLKKQAFGRTGRRSDLPLHSGYPHRTGGKALPNEFELGEKFGVGRSTIREARKHFKMI